MKRFDLKVEIFQYRKCFGKTLANFHNEILTCTTAPGTFATCLKEHFVELHSPADEAPLKQAGHIQYGSQESGQIF